MSSIEHYCTVYSTDCMVDVVSVSQISSDKLFENCSVGLAVATLTVLDENSGIVLSVRLSVYLARRPAGRRIDFASAI
jgi:hypothetical protein